jgi:hypothetical protein
VPDAREVDAPPVNVGCPDAVQCDDFEAGDLAAWTVKQSVSDATVAVSAGQAHSGMRAVEATVPVKPFSGSSAYISRDSALQSTGMLAARVWIYAPQPVDDFSGVLRFGGPDRYVMVSGNNLERWTVSENSAAGLFDHTSNVTAVPNAWTCLELVYTFSPPRIRLFIDETMVIDQAAQDGTPMFDEAGAGVTRAPLAGFRVFVDDFVVANQPIGCN